MPAMVGVAAQQFAVLEQENKHDSGDESAYVGPERYPTALCAE